MVLTVIIAALGGFIAGVFVYRNNAKDIGKIADAASTVTGVEYCAITALEETVISACTEMPQNPAGDTSFTGTLAAGTTLVGLFKDITITSGTLRCTLASPNQ